MKKGFGGRRRKWTDEKRKNNRRLRKIESNFQKPERVLGGF